MGAHPTGPVEFVAYNRSGTARMRERQAGFPDWVGETGQ